MSTFQAKYTDEQKDAIVAAYLDQGIRPARKVCDLAAAGKLGLEPFTITQDMVRWAARRERQRRVGKITSQLAQQPPRDAIEAMRRRLVNLTDALLKDAERKAGRKEHDPKRLTEIARCLREIAAIPGPNDARPVKPGDKIPGGGGAKNGERTRSGPVAAMLAELQHERVHPAKTVQTGTAPPTPNRKQSEDGRSEARASHNAATHGEHDDENARPDSWARSQVAGLAQQH